MRIFHLSLFSSHSYKDISIAHLAARDREWALEIFIRITSQGITILLPFLARSVTKFKVGLCFSFLETAMALSSKLSQKKKKKKKMFIQAG